jgi:hypothetical protein
LVLHEGLHQRVAVTRPSGTSKGSTKQLKVLHEGCDTGNGNVGGGGAAAAIAASSVSTLWQLY